MKAERRWARAKLRCLICFLRLSKFSPRRTQQPILSNTEGLTTPGDTAVLFWASPRSLVEHHLSKHRLAVYDLLPEGASDIGGSHLDVLTDWEQLQNV